MTNSSAEKGISDLCGRDCSCCGSNGPTRTWAIGQSRIELKITNNETELYERAMQQIGVDWRLKNYLPPVQ